MDLRTTTAALWLWVAWLGLALRPGPSLPDAPTCPDGARAQVDGGAARGELVLLLCPDEVGGRATRLPAGAPGLLVGRRVDVERATEAELMALPGIGPGLARRIVDDRTERGPFRSVEALERVRGLGPGRIRALAGLATTGGAGGGATD